MGNAAYESGGAVMISAEAIRAILHDPAIHPVAAKLYVLLSEGKTLDEVAVSMKKAPKSLARYERQLRKAGVLDPRPRANQRRQEESALPFQSGGGRKRALGELDDGKTKTPVAATTDVSYSFRPRR